MVLQRDATPSVYGLVAHPSAAVTVSVASAHSDSYQRQATVMPAGDGMVAWKAYLDPAPVRANYYQGPKH